MHEVSGDAWSPAEIAGRVEQVGVTKARMDLVSMLLLAGLAGAFISLGGLFYLVTTTDSSLGFGPTRLIGGLAFSLGLVLVVVAGAELFTGNNLVAMAWVSCRISTFELLRGWILVYMGNVVGALLTVALVVATGVADLAVGAVGQRALQIGATKASTGFFQGVALGALCNALVCLGVWIAMGSRSVTDKVIGVVFPVTAFVTLGFEHSIANWFFLPYAWALGAGGDAGFLAGAWTNLVSVTIGNVIGGTVLVAGVYWLAYLRLELKSGRRGE